MPTRRRRPLPEIFLLNRGVIHNPDLIFPGQVLMLPSGPAVVPEPRIYVVKPGETLSSIAQDQLGDASRFNEIVALNLGQSPTLTSSSPTR